MAAATARSKKLPVPIRIDGLDAQCATVISCLSTQKVALSANLCRQRWIGNADR
jgi:hypothetical protein